MIVKVSVSFLNSDSDAQLITDTNSIIGSLTGNASFPNATPPLADAAGGGVTLTSVKNDKREALVALLRELSSYVQVACKGDMTVLLTSGFSVQKTQRNPIGVLPAPTNVSIALGSRSGELDASMPPVFGAAVYNWKLAAASAPTVVLQTAQTTAASNGFTGLTPGVVYLAQVNAVGSAGLSDWSEPISQMAV